MLNKLYRASNTKALYLDGCYEAPHAEARMSPKLRAILFLLGVLASSLLLLRYVAKFIVWVGS